MRDSEWESELIRRYQAVEVPETIRSMDAIDPLVQRAEDEFFKSVTDSLQLTYLARVSFLSIQRYMLVQPERDMPEKSEDFITKLEYKNIQTLASVLKVRDDVNFQVAHFSLYGLLDDTLDDLFGIEEVERTIARLQLGLE